MRSMKNINLRHGAGYKAPLVVRWEGDNGRHARTAIGVAQLPFGAAVQLEMVLRLKDNFEVWLGNTVSSRAAVARYRY